MPKVKGQMEPGKRYRGYGFINEYKEFCFEPEHTGAHAGQIKEICVREGVRVAESKNLIIIKINLNKQNNRIGLLKELMRSYNILSQILQDYEI